MADVQEIPAEAVMEAIEYPDFVYIIQLRKKVPTSSLDNLDVIKVEGTNRRRLVGTYTEQGADGQTVVHNVSVYIKSAKSDGEDGEPKRRSRKSTKSDSGPDAAISKKGSRKAKKFTEKETELIGQILVDLGKLQKLHKSSRKQAAAAAAAPEQEA